MIYLTFDLSKQFVYVFFLNDNKTASDSAYSRGIDLGIYINLVNPKP